MPTLRYILRYKLILVYTLEIPLIIRECLRELEIPLIIRECLREPLTKSKLTEVILKSSMRYYPSVEDMYARLGNFSGV